MTGRPRQAPAGPSAAGGAFQAVIRVVLAPELCLWRPRCGARERSGRGPSRTSWAPQVLGAFLPPLAVQASGPPAARLGVNKETVRARIPSALLPGLSPGLRGEPESGQAAPGAVGYGRSWKVTAVLGGPLALGSCHSEPADHSGSSLRSRLSLPRTPRLCPARELASVRGTLEGPRPPANGSMRTHNPRDR